MQFPSRAAAAAAVFLAAACGCRSAPGPTFASVGSHDAPAAARMPAAGEAAGLPAAERTNGLAANRVQPAAEELPTAAPQSAFTRLLGPFARPRRIPLPRTDLDEAPHRDYGDDLPETDLAEAF